jgi:hypothetical protein
MEVRLRPRSLAAIVLAAVAAACGTSPPRAAPTPTADAGLGDSGVPDATGADANIDADAGATSDGAPPGPTRFALNDVSFLYPLPAPDHVDDLLALSRTGAHGPLLAASTYAAFSAVEPPFTAVAFDRFRVVTVRVDPCLPLAAPPVDAGACAREIRLVAQPVIVDATGQALMTSDVAIHLFYDLDDATWADLLSGLAALKGMAGAATDGVPLGVHPMMAAQGLTGAYAQALDQLVLGHAGDANLVRMAFAIAEFDEDWQFGSLDRSGDTWAPTAIPLLNGATGQQFSNTQSPGGMPNVGSVSPAPTADDLSLLLDDTALAAAPIDQVTAVAREALSVENPDLTNRVTTDCITCHVASRARGNAESARALDTTIFPERYFNASFDLARTSQAGNARESQRGFGYFGAETAFTQRTINESAVVAAALSSP